MDVAVKMECSSEVSLNLVERYVGKELLDTIASQNICFGCLLDSNKYPKHIFGILNIIFFYYFWLFATSCEKVSRLSNCLYNEHGFISGVGIKRLD